MRRYQEALAECKDLAAADSEEIVAKAYAKVISGQADGGASEADPGSAKQTSLRVAHEADALCEALLSNFVALREATWSLRWLETHWREVCAEFDVDASGTLSADEAVAIWDDVIIGTTVAIAGKLDKLGAPPRLYRGDLCMATVKARAGSAAAAAAAGPPPSKRVLSLYVDPTHVQLFDDLASGGDEKLHEAQRVEAATSQDREVAIAKYLKAVGQCKAIARRKTTEVINKAFAKVREQMGGSLGEQGKIDYTLSAGEEAREGQLLCAALVANFGALQRESAAVEWISSHWREACAQADEDASGTISRQEAHAIWDRLLVDITRAVTTKLTKLGVNATPLFLSPGDLCMVRPVGDTSSPLTLAVYVDDSHAIFFDDYNAVGDEEAHEVSRVGPATSADKEVANVKYLKALERCQHLAATDSSELVLEVFARVHQALGNGVLGDDSQPGDASLTLSSESGSMRMDVLEVLCDEIMSHFGALAEEARALRWMKAHWNEICAEADADVSGTISEEEMVSIWERVLEGFTKMVLSKLAKLGAASQNLAC